LRSELGGLINVFLAEKHFEGCGGLEITDEIKVTIAAQAGVINNISDNKVILGSPAIEANLGRRVYSMIQYLPEMRQSIRNLQNQIRQIVSPVDDDAEESVEHDGDV